MVILGMVFLALAPYLEHLGADESSNDSTDWASAGAAVKHPLTACESDPEFGQFGSTRYPLVIC